MMQTRAWASDRSAWWAPGLADIVSGSTPPDPDPEGNPGVGWWPSDLSAPMSQAQLKDPDNFGPPPGYSFSNTMPANQLASSPLSVFEGYHFTGLSGTSYVLNLKNKTFINCLWDDYPVFGLGAFNVTLTNCASRKLIIVSGSTDIRFNKHRLTGIGGTDAIHITNDRSGHSKPLRITFDGIHAVGSKELYIVGENHMDSIQVRGCDDLVLHNFCFDHGTTFDTLFTATVFIENANGGSNRVLVNNGYSRSQGYRHFMMFGLSGQQVKNVWFADTGATLLHNSGAGQTIDVEYNNKWENGTPIPTLFGV